MNSSVFFTIFALVFSSSFTISYAEFRLMVIHNNDMHARFEETNAYGAPCKRDRCFGGFARMKTAIREAIEEANKNNIPYVVLNAGDSFQGTPYYDIKKWLIVQPLLESLLIDAMTLGNHEFDDGIGSLAEYLKNIKIPVVCCNLNLTTEQRLILPNLTPSRILNVNGTKIGVIGFLTPDTMFLSKTENLRIEDEIPLIRAEAKRLKESGVKIIIGLGHSGFDREVEIAGEIAELSLIVGGHSHSLLYSPKDRPPSIELIRESYPFMVTQKSGRKVPVVQAGAFTKYLGKLMLVFDDDGNVVSGTGNPRLLDSTITEDAELKKLIDFWVGPLRHNLKAVKGYSRVPLLLSDFVNGHYESNLGNLIADAIVDYGIRRPHNDSDERWTSAAISFVNMGGIRSQIEESGSITLEDILMVIPFANEIYEVQYDGWVIKKALEHSVKSLSDFMYYLYFSGLRVRYDLTRQVDDRVESVEVLCSDCAVPRYETLQDNKTYTVLIGDYLMRGGHEYSMFKSEKKHAVNLGIKDTAIMIAYIEMERIIYPVLDGRIMAKNSAHSHAITFRATSNVIFTNTASTRTIIFHYLFLISMFYIGIYVIYNE